ncbi:hypothetical protein [Fervidobacterium thailandense]|uniref:Uncharacterized protein n=1 Tax=Fervidobacterium thailandense TaxID=1008305 RepID=A0A1E3G5H1_9BACT|nr:hypothetical protein [Fervidobacterium thailandense]ODN31103.1 hypothetical protein A4H02_02215 [Fervidobacterium thailandense]
MKKRVPIGSRKWKEITDFDLKVISVVIVALSLTTLSLLLYAVYLKFQKSQVEVTIKESTPVQQPPIEEVVRTATETLYYIKPDIKPSSTEEPESTDTAVSQNPVGGTTTRVPDEGLTIVPLDEGTTAATNSTEVELAKQPTQTEQPTQPAQAQPQQPGDGEVTEKSEEVEENRYLKGLTKFDYNLLLSRMAENLPSTKLYLYVVDGETALKLAKMTTNYVIDQVGGKYHLACTKNIAPDLNPSVGIYTVKTKPIKDSKEVFKSVVNLRTFGISAFSVSTSEGLILCMGVFRTEAQARSFYYSQDWSELSKYANVSGASVSKIGD